MVDEIKTDQGKEEELTKLRRQAMVLHTPEFVQLSRTYLGLIPLAGAAAFALKDGHEGILINYDYYQKSLGQDFSDCIDFEIEHEANELLLTRGKEKVDAFGPDHYAASRLATALAYKQGKLDRYLELKRAQFKMFDAAGDSRAMEELDFYKKVASQLEK
ncbi:hypothetical protein A3I57_02915 [Candidatus Beckwithbacteria bacterium RIFCSPLOWO2_02_FULL_47_23]|uniref:Uncharacterized protein n=2 Tax=Candidatus Beckwithiibacteriota TaxID=1752726 RepID=A0A1F5DZ90_9BACT|nr:MAG: hypothetical protein A3E73_00435 [Candidatus Beckwithbacteria bacterium RIFCSPHIGHO2_12_FULL_47_17]OGD60468.1 MAG: hypothetical protein A3I57_02915 [Candidatus Beckwithbacteria bacterium RIFCSPLOWO2_02_FULL_47_23]